MLCIYLSVRTFVSEIIKAYGSQLNRRPFLCLLHGIFRHLCAPVLPVIIFKSFLCIRHSFLAVKLCHLSFVVAIYRLLYRSDMIFQASVPDPSVFGFYRCSVRRDEPLIFNTSHIFFDRLFTHADRRIHPYIHSSML